MKKLTIILTFRDRDLQRLERCLQSLDRQTFRDFELFFVDYGSQTSVARAVQQLVEQFTFARYIYSDTRGYPWNRSRALNIGAKLAQSEYILNTDVDIVFSHNFLQIVMERAGRRKILHCAPHLLKQNFQDWDHVESYSGKFPVIETAKGVCQVISTETFHQLHGFDEAYQYWGTEDRDLYQRLLVLGFEEIWLNDRTSIFHQWHPPINVRTVNFMPDASWRRAQMHFYQHFSETIRNQQDGWGKVTLTAERRVLEFLDLDVPRILEHPTLVILDESPYLDGSIVKFIDCFLNLPGGHAIAVNQANFPVAPHWAGDILMRGINKMLEWAGGKTRLNWQANTLHAFLAEFVEQNPEQVADYYLKLPVKDGVSIIVKK